MTSNQDYLAAALNEQASRERESIRMFRALEHQMPFFESESQVRLVRGGVRSGKSTCAAVEFAAAVTGSQVMRPDGSFIPYRYPTGRPMNCWVIGYDENHIGKTLYRLLFKPGAFKIIQDLKTNLWRSYRPWDESDVARVKEVRPAPPLIPPRLVDPKGWSWTSKVKRQFDYCKLKNGTNIYAYSSKADASQGDAVDLIWIDEDIWNPDNYMEWESRLSDERGRLIWSAFPHSDNYALHDLSIRADKERDEGRKVPVCYELVIRQQDNPYIPADQIAARKEGMSEDEWRARNGGEFLHDTVNVFPMFDSDRHLTPAKTPEGDDAVDAIIRRRGHIPPPDWTRFLILDPGTSTAAVLFGAIPPPEFGECYIAYDEIYQKQSTAEMLAQAVREKVQGQNFEMFIIDNHAGRKTPEGFGETVQDQYVKAFRKHGIESRSTGHSFLPGDGNIMAGVGAVAHWLGNLSDMNRPLFRCHRDTTRWTQWEFKNWRKQVKGRDDVTDTPLKKNDHLMSCMRYWAMSKPMYHKPLTGNPKGSAAFQAFNEWMKLRAQQGGDEIELSPRLQ